MGIIPGLGLSKIVIRRQQTENAISGFVEFLPGLPQRPTSIRVHPLVNGSRLLPIASQDLCCLLAK